MTTATSPPVRERRRLGRHIFAAVAVLATGVLAASAPAPVAAEVANDDWKSIVNTYRAMSGLAPVTENTTWSAQGRAHSCYMLLNGIAHDEIPGKPGYTAGGDIAGNSGNVATSSSVSATARNHIDLWMTGPFHAIGILRHNLRTSGFGLCAEVDTPTPWSSGGTLDVIRGLDYSVPRRISPTLFPGDGATVPLYRFVTEYPNPMTMCGWTGEAGLPLIAMMPNGVSSANSTLTGPNGPVQTCTLHPGNANDATAKSILGGDNAVVVMPREVLVDGTYTATVNTNGGNVTWSFTIDKDGILSSSAGQVPTVTATDTSTVGDQVRFEPVTPYRLVDSRVRKGTSRLQAGKAVEISVGSSSKTAVSANFVAVNPAGSGFLTAYNCTADRPEVSTLNFGRGEVVSNQAVVPLKSGKLCLYSPVATDVVIDVNGFFHDGASGAFTPEVPDRLLDTRAAGQQRLRAVEERELKIAGSKSAAPSSATAVSLNVTVTEPVAPGFLTVYPCGLSAGTEISTINYMAGQTRPNSVVVPVGTSGKICLQSNVTTDVIVDYTGYFSDIGDLDFQPLEPIRMFDSRSTNTAFNSLTNGGRVSGWIRLQIAGKRGIPEGAVAVSLNLTATQPLGPSFLTAYPCGLRPSTSTVNISSPQVATANGGMVKLSSDGGLCVYTQSTTHIIVDVNGVYL